VGQLQADWMDPKRTAILVIDMQNDFCSKKGASGKTGDYEFRCEAAKNLTKFLGATRAKRLPILHAKTVHSKWTDTPAWTARNKEGSNICRMGTWGTEWWEEFSELTPKSDEYVVVKHRYSALIGTDLDLVLRSRELKCVILAGVSTNWCVESTARDAYMLGYTTVVLSDCCASKSRELHASSLDVMGKVGVVITTSGEVLKAWEG
jgi:ureidoacrylate peracid hydrolase